MTYQLTASPSGLRIATEHLPGVESVSLAVTVDVGARSEMAGEGGISHLLEHMAFKGTTTRSARQIAEEFDDIGGNLNAYTSLENTVYYAKVLARDLPVAIDMLTDIVQHSVFDAGELTREKGVILQELAMHYDTPEDLVFDYFHATAFPEQPLGRSILGTSETVNSFSREQVQGYMRRHYQPGRMVISAAGAVSHALLVEAIEERFQPFPAHPVIPDETGFYRGGEKRQERDLEQLHYMLGLEGVSIHDPDYYALQMLSIILGGGMSSRLFQEVREKRGLAYTVQAFVSSYSDSGLLGIYAATAEESARELVPVLCDELMKLTLPAAQGGASAAELKRAKNQHVAGVVMARESTSSVAEWIGRHLVAYGTYHTSADIIAKAEAVTLDDITRVAKRLLAGGTPTVAALGPLSGVESYEDTAARLKL